MILNFLSFVGFITFALSGITAYSVIRKGIKEAHVAWFLFSISIALWGLGLFFSFSNTNHDQALFWSRFLNTIAIFIGVFFTHFVYCVLNISQRNQKKLMIFYGITFLYCLCSIVFYQEFIRDVSSRPYFLFYPDAGIVYYLFPLLFTYFIVVEGFYLLYKARTNSTIQQKQQINYILVATSIGLIGGATTFPLVFHIDVYPVGAIGIALMDIIIAYAIIKHKLLDISLAISVIIGRIIAYLGLVTILFLSYFIITGRYIPEDKLLAFAVISFLILTCETYSIIIEKIQGLSEAIIVKERKKQLEAIKVLTKGLDNLLSIRQLKNFLEGFLSKNLDSELVSFYIREDQLFPEKSVSAEDDNSSEKKIEDSYLLVDTATDLYDQTEDKDSVKSKIILTKEFIEKIILLRSFAEIDESIFSNLSKNSILIPFLINERVIGFALASREEGHQFTHWHHEIFNLLTTQLAVILDRIFAYKKISYQKEKFLQDQIEAKKILANAIAHEMRNPMSSIAFSVNSFHDLLRGESPDGSIVLSPDKVKEMKDTNELLESVTTHAHETIDDILAEARGEKVKVNYTYLSAKKEINQAILESGFIEEHRKKIINDVQDDFIFKGNETQFIRVINNLIKNALEFLKDKPSLTVTISSEIAEAHNIIHIADTGPGMTEEIRAKLYQGKMVTSGKDGGTGIGSNVCKHIMVGFGGDITCISEVGKGTIISLLFPKLEQEELDKAAADRTNPRKRGAEEGEFSDFSNFAFIIIDDNESIIKQAVLFASRKLKGRVDSATSIKDAIDKLSKTKYNMIFLDIQFVGNELAGLEIAKQIKANPAISAKNKDAILIYTSGEKNDEIFKEGGFTDYLGKLTPFNLLPIVEKWLGKGKKKKD